MVTATLLVQVVAALSIPLSLAIVAFARTTVQKPIRTKDLVLATQFAIVPALLILAVRGLLPWWAAAIGFALVALLAYDQSRRSG